MILLIDNYDSFTFNLVHYFGELGEECEVHRNDALSVNDVVARAPEAIVLSPGPCSPDEAGICCDVIRALGSTTPIFGVCLGHQAIGQVYGGKVGRAPMPVHGKVSAIHHTNTGVFSGLPDPLMATRYHSLIVEADTLPDVLHRTAWTDDGLIMGLQHRQFPVHGVQFHPESIASECGHEILKNFLTLAREWNEGRRAA
ncbi:anthranilate synthase component II [Acetobacter estunensis NRIC 0472]|uniref:Aminodeoxychorismate/anthranilate synthase component II n=1 Tax=Acetobacter estunensis TaxID=104097 RepID=A0A967B537_9PROT|nr:aminodeoxychorismate/anthranilate synthase component II [Acetobacter estunensis]NHO53937.1 aminodeoxychorismate/anthranilate synthase component II [Acetobacter estunensis]GBQ26849.1 anthranilate synthase component II [Acetobacter estunensis NRIC 0472]